jgi:hypothetical protein
MPKVKYRAERDGEVVFKATVDIGAGEPPVAKHFGEWLSRPAETPFDQPNPSPVYLYINDGGDGGDVLVGIQRSHQDEASECRIAAAWYYAGFEAGQGAHLEQLAWHMDQMAQDADTNAKRALIAQAQAGF